MIHTAVACVLLLLIIACSWHVLAQKRRSHPLKPGLHSSPCCGFGDWLQPQQLPAPFRGVRPKGL